MTKHSFPYMDGQVAKSASERTPSQELFKTAAGRLLQDKLFLSRELRVDHFCNMLGVTQNTLSKTLKVHGFCNFAHFINYHRVEEAKRMMAVPEFNMYTLEAIAEMAGFGTRQSFYDAFEKITGEKPARYRRMVKKADAVGH